MYYCNRCGLTSAEACREAHAAWTREREQRHAKMHEIRAMLEAMTDEEFREFNHRMTRG